MDEHLIANVEYLNSSERYSDGVVILLRLLDNVIREPQNTKYRAIRLENKVIKEKLLCLNGIRELLTSIGFEEVCVMFISPLIEILNYVMRLSVRFLHHQMLEAFLQLSHE